MRRTTTIVVVGVLLAALAVGALVPAASAHQGTDQQTSTPYGDAENATEVRAQSVAHSMETRMGSEGVAAFEKQTGTTIDAVAHAMAEQMGPWAGQWGAPTERGQYGPSGYGTGSQGSGGYGPGGSGPGGHGPQMPCGGGYGHGMAGSGHGMGGGW